MPHISIKMLKGRTEEQKRLAAEKLAQALIESIGCSPSHVSVSVEDFTPEEWQEQYKIEITENQKNLVIKPDYRPEDVL
ncbi:MAG: 4-oxalocrotonate tautomerase family protein [Oscillospiraceae bacterium]|nr:4-oxalocrotonate tautomerase family protein [Oscillospiraceae bacterium]MDE5884958.1 4-oxalocrotonate tautomerase family protein [Oscillospiraceae bacterium]